MILGIDASQANRTVRSGTEWYAFYLIEEFKKLLRDRTDVKTRLYFRDQPREDLLANLPANWEIKILKWPVRYFWGQLRLSWEMLVNPPDVLFCPAHTIPLIHPHPLPNPPHKGEGIKRGGKTFTTLHDIGFVDNPELYDNLSLWYHRFSAWLAVRSAYHIFTVSEFSKKRIVEHYHCPAAKISVIHLGITAPSSPPKIGGEKGGILFIGGLEPKKNILRMVKAFEKFLEDHPHLASPLEGEEIKLVLAGRAINIVDALEYLAARPDLRDKVKFLGYIDERKKQELLRGASIFLFPTLYEGFGLPILEAQAAGVPVVTSNTTSNPEIAGQGAVLVDPHNVKEIASAIKELLTNQELRNQKIKAGFENIKRFSWEQTAKQTLWILSKSKT